MSEPAAWAVIEGDRIRVMGVSRESVEEEVGSGDRLVPLYGSPSLTDAEREAIEWSILEAEATIGLANEQGTIDGAEKTSKALRGLLLRTAVRSREKRRL